MVGCVIVRGGEIVGGGWHAEYGGPHAERVALSAAGESANGATAYVSLEPCRHHGKTPPCTQALSSAGIRRVVYGACDPGPVSGGGAEALREAGAQVEGPALGAREARILNPGFFHADPERPWTALKLAVSLDGRISTAEGTRTQLTGREADECVQWLRAGFDAILVGTQTALVDNPLLTIRGELTPPTPPRRVVLDARGRLPASARMLREGEGAVFLYTTPSSPPAWRRSIEQAGGRVTEVAGGDAGGVSLPAVLGSLRASGISHLLCEGGEGWRAPFCGRGSWTGCISSLSPASSAPRALRPSAGSRWNRPPRRGSSRTGRRGGSGSMSRDVSGRTYGPSSSRTRRGDVHGDRRGAWPYP